MLLLAVTGNQGKPGTGLQMSNYDFETQIAYMIADLPPPRIATTSRWDYTHARHKELKESTDAKILAILTPEQQEKYKALGKMRRGKRAFGKGRRGKGGPGGPPPHEEKPETEQ